MRHYITLLVCLLALTVAQAQDVIIRRNTTTTTTTTSTTTVSKPKQKPKTNPKPKPRKQSPTDVPEQTFTVNGVSFKMIRVDGGTFTMGATSEQGSDAGGSEKPAHQVTLSTYYICETEVTQDLWQAVMGSTVAQQRDKTNKEWPLRGVGGNYPMYYISWEECQTFIRRLNALTGKNFRLPTEAEWEFAARGGNKTQGYKYSGSNSLGNVAWYTDNSGNETHPGKQKSPNELGLYDMSGNVGEWCQDWFGSYSSSSQTNPTGASSGSYRVSRGGCWFFNAWSCRVSDRSYITPGYRSYYHGLRLVL